MLQFLHVIGHTIQNRFLNQFLFSQTFDNFLGV